MVSSKSLIQCWDHVLWHQIFFTPWANTHCEAFWYLRQCRRLGFFIVFGHVSDWRDEGEGQWSFLPIIDKGLFGCVYWITWWLIFIDPILSLHPLRSSYYTYRPCPGADTEIQSTQQKQGNDTNNAIRHQESSPWGHRQRRSCLSTRHERRQSCHCH